MAEYKRLGDYIEPVDERNSKLEIKLSQGICNEKYFQDPRQVAENSAADKIVRQGYFAYNRATTRNGEKISIAYREGPDCTVSSAYQVFRIKDEEKLNPKYLLMWYKRSDFDRYARFRSHGSAHEFFEYDEMCDVYLPLPDIDRQREIVEEYEMLSRRIRLNEQMIKKLEATTQTLYCKMFVDGIDKENLPAGWRNGVLGEVCETQYGYTETATQQIVGPKFLRITDVVNDSIDWSKVPYCPISEKELKKYKLGLGDIVVSRTGANIGWAKQIKGDIPDSVFASFLIRIKAKDADMQWMIGHLVESSDFKAFVAANQQGSAQPQANANILVEFPLIIPDTDSLQLYNLHILPINRMLCVKEQENTKLSELQSLLLAKMGNLKQ